jgi:hypothetical protein
MTRPTAMTTAKRPARSRKRAPVRLTAHIEYQPAGLDLSGRRVREAYHAITDQAVRVGVLTRWPGDALCGAPGPWADIPDGLFAPHVSCRVCLHITANEHMTITGGMP